MSYFLSSRGQLLLMAFGAGLVRRFWDREPLWQDRLLQCAARMLAAVRQGIPLEPRCAGDELVFWMLPLDDEVIMQKEF